MVRVLRRIALVALSMLHVGCASGGAGAGAAPDGSSTALTSASTRRVTPPRMVTRGVFELRGAGDLRISVVVAADGQPRIGTLRVTGSGAGTQRPAIEQWIRTSTFEAGRQGSEPVEAVFEVQLRSVTRVRRM